MIEVFSGNSWSLPTRQSDWQIHNCAAHSLKLEPRDHEAKINSMLSRFGIDPSTAHDDSFSASILSDALLVAYLPPSRPSLAEQVNFSVLRALEDQDTVDRATGREDPFFDNDFNPNNQEIKWFRYRPNTEAQHLIVRNLEQVHEPFVNFLSSISFLAVKGSELIVEDTYSKFELGDRDLFDMLLQEEVDKEPEYGLDFSQ